MADADHTRHPHQFLKSLQRHVLSPLSTADRVLERERIEITAEEDAFRTFMKRLAKIDPVAEPTIQSPSPGVAIHEPSARQMERVRAAYRKTVMTVSHYDDVYGKSLVENVAAEFGLILAEGLRLDESVPLTPAYKTAFRTAAVKAVQERGVFIDALEGNPSRSSVRAPNSPTSSPSLTPP